MAEIRVGEHGGLAADGARGVTRIGARIEQGCDGVERVAKTPARDQQPAEARAQLRGRRVVRRFREAALERQARALGVAPPRPQPGLALGARRPGPAVSGRRSRGLQGARRVLVTPEQAKAGRERQALRGVEPVGRERRRPFVKQRGTRRTTVGARRRGGGSAEDRHRLLRLPRRQQRVGAARIVGRQMRERAHGDARPQRRLRGGQRGAPVRRARQAHGTVGRRLEPAGGAGTGGRRVGVHGRGQRARARSDSHAPSASAIASASACASPGSAR